MNLLGQNLVRRALAKAARRRLFEPIRPLARNGLIGRRIWIRLPAPIEPFSVPVRGANSPIRYAPGPSDILSRPMYWKGLHGSEPELWNLMRSELTRTQGKIVVDVGANTGIYSLGAIAVNDSISVVAYEPHPRVQVYLRRNTELNDRHGRILVRPVAVGSTAGTAEFDLTASDLPTSGRLRSAAYRFPVNDETMTTVSLVTLDEDLADRESAVGIVKIDVEGAEDSVLEGASRILNVDRPVVFFECHAEARGDTTWSLLKKAQYDIFRILPDKIEPAQQPPTSSDERRLRNYLARPHAR